MSLSKKFIGTQLKQLAKEYSGDRKTQVAAGCYVNGKLIFGVNHLAYDLPEDDIVSRTALFYATMTHAEIDLCNKADVRGKTVYVTLFPCNNCASKLIAAGVKNIVAYEDRPTADYIIKAKELLDSNGIPWQVIA